MDKKRRIYRLLEDYINSFRKEAVESFYGKGTYIKIHSMYQSISTKSLLFEIVVVLGDVINEDVMDRSLVDVLIQDAIIYFFPDQNIKTYVRWDV